jgi:hypothetical protein
MTRSHGAAWGRNRNNEGAKVGTRTLHPVPRSSGRLRRSSLSLWETAGGERPRSCPPTSSEEEGGESGALAG